MTLRKIMVALVVLAAILGLSGDAHSEGLDLLQSKKYGYVLRVSQTASRQLLPGDLLQVGVLSGPGEARSTEIVVKRAQLLQIHESTPNRTASLVLALNRKEIRLMQMAMKKPQAAVTLRLVKKQPRHGAAGVSSPDDALPDLNFENDLDLAKN